MANTLMSRFSVLPDDVDDDYSTKRKRPPVKKPEPNKAPTFNSKLDGKKKKNKENAQTQSTKPKVKSSNNNNNGTAKKKKKESSPEQWEEWKQKDEKMVEGNYEDELSQALLLSKLDYEEKKDVYEQASNGVEAERKPGQKKNKKQIRVLSVEEFHNLGKPKQPEEPPEVDRDDPELLQRIKEDARKEIAKENATRKTPKKAPRIPFDEEALSLAQVKDALEKRVAEVDELKAENSKLKDELLAVKSRNKKLFQILANGEMMDKAQVLVEVEGLRKVQVELLAEVETLHEQLEQERSKVRALTSDPKSKDKNKKRTTSSGDQ